MCTDTGNAFVLLATVPGITITTEVHVVVPVRERVKKPTLDPNLKVDLMYLHTRNDIVKLIETFHVDFCPVPKLLKCFDALVENLNPDQMTSLTIGYFQDLWGFTEFSETQRYLQYFCGAVGLLGVRFFTRELIELDSNDLLDLNTQNIDAIKPLSVYFYGTEKLKTILEESR